MATPLNSCLFPKCIFAHDSGALKGSYAVYPSVLISRPDSTNLTLVGNDLVSSNELRGRVIQTEGVCPLQSIFVMDVEGPHTLELSGLDRGLVTSQTFSALFRPDIGAKQTHAEHIVLPAYQIVEAGKANEFSLQVVTGMGSAFLEPSDLSPQRAGEIAVAGGDMIVRPSKVQIDVGETEVERAISAISTVVPGVRDALSELTDDRSSSAVLSITSGSGEAAEVAFELQSREGGVWFETFRLSAADRAELFLIVDIFAGKDSSKIPY